MRWAATIDYSRPILGDHQELAHNTQPQRAILLHRSGICQQSPAVLCFFFPLFPTTNPFFLLAQTNGGKPFLSPSNLSVKSFTPLCRGVKTHKSSCAFDELWENFFKACIYFPHHPIPPLWLTSQTSPHASHLFFPLMIRGKKKSEVQTNEVFCSLCYY